MNHCRRTSSFVVSLVLLVACSPDNDAGIGDANGKIEGGGQGGTGGAGGSGNAGAGGGAGKEGTGASAGAAAGGAAAGGAGGGAGAGPGGNSCAQAQIQTACGQGGSPGAGCCPLAGQFYDTQQMCHRYLLLTCSNACGAGELEACYEVTAADGHKDLLVTNNDQGSTPELEALGIHKVGCNPDALAGYTACP